MLNMSSEHDIKPWRFYKVRQLPWWDTKVQPLITLMLTMPKEPLRQPKKHLPMHFMPLNQSPLRQSHEELHFMPIALNNRCKWLHAMHLMSSG